MSKTSSTGALATEDDLKQDITEEQFRLREQLRLLANEVNDEIYQQRQHLFGRVATIIEAVTTDPEQRKAVKDLLSNAIYGDSYWNNARYQFEQLARANGFELWETLDNTPDAVMPVEPVNKYEKV